MGLEVYEAAKTKGRLLVVEEAGHNDVAAVAGDDYWRWITEALKPVAGIAAAADRKKEGVT
jgi:hypothetical protein